MKKPIAPCYKCEERELGCHSTCERYLTYAGMNALAREERYNNLERESHTHTKYTTTERKRRLQSGSNTKKR